MSPQRFHNVINKVPMMSLKWLQGYLWCFIVINMLSKTRFFPFPEYPTLVSKHLTDPFVSEVLWVSLTEKLNDGFSLWTACSAIPKATPLFLTKQYDNPQMLPCVTHTLEDKSCFHRGFISMLPEASVVRLRAKQQWRIVTNASTSLN